MSLNTGTFNVAPEDQPKIDWRRRMALQLMQQGTDPGPVGHPMAALAKALQATLGGYELYKADESDKAKEQRVASGIDKFPGMERQAALTAPDEPPMQPSSPSPNTRRIANALDPNPYPGGSYEGLPGWEPGERPIDSPAPQFNERYAAATPQGPRATPVKTERYTPPPAIVAPQGSAGAPPSAPAVPPQQVAQATQGQPGARSGPALTPLQQHQIRGLYQDPATRALGIDLYNKLTAPKDQWEEETTPAGAKILRNRATNDVKAYPGNPEYNFTPRADGAVIVTNKNNPADTQVVKPPGSSQAIADAKALEKSAEEQAKAQATAAAGIPGTEAKAQQALDTIEKIRNHPGRQYGTGVLGVLPGIPGTDQRGFVSLVDQAKGQVFLDAYEALKGAGQITEVEGAKAERARARLDRAQKSEDFESALNDFRDVVKAGLARSKTQATATAVPPGGPLPASGVPDRGKEIAPGIFMRQK